MEMLDFLGIHSVDCDVCENLKFRVINFSSSEWICHVQEIREFHSWGVLSLFLRLKDRDVKTIKLLLEKMPRSNRYYLQFIHNRLLDLPNLAYDGFNDIKVTMPGCENYKRYMNVIQLLFNAMDDNYVDAETGDTKMHLAVETSQWEWINRLLVEEAFYEVENE